MSRLPIKHLEIVSRLLIDLRGYDSGFIRKCEEIFEINVRHDKLDGSMLMEWMEYTVSEIVSLFSINPTTLFGTINIGPNLSEYRGIENYSSAQLDEFSLQYKAFATNVYQALSQKLEPYINESIDKGYSDVSCSVARFVPGALLLNMRAIQPFPEHPYSNGV